MNLEKNKKGIFQRKNIVGYGFILIAFLTTLLYFVFLEKKGNDVFTQEFRKSIWEAKWQYLVPIPSFEIIMKTDDNIYAVTVFEKYIEVKSDYYIAAKILGRGEPKVNYYKASKDFTKDKELMDVFFKYVHIFENDAESQ